MNSDRKIHGKVAVAVMVAGTLMLAACNEQEKVRQLVDTKPIGEGLEFMGLMLVLSLLVFVFGKFIEQSVIAKWTYLPYVLVALLIILSLLVIASAVPNLVIPFGVAVVLAVALALAWHHWKK